MATPFDQLSDLALEVYALAMAARSCPTYEAGLSITARLRAAGDRLSKLAPAVFDSMTDRVLRQLMELRFPEIAAEDIATAIASREDEPSDDES
jgi:hypothetical protein